MAGSGTTLFDSGSRVNLTGNSNKGIDRLVRNLGTIDYTGTRLLFALNGNVSGVLENQAGAPSFLSMRARSNDHLIEEVGEKLRGMMHWAQNDRLVDKSRN